MKINRFINPFAWDSTPPINILRGVNCNRICSAFTAIGKAAHKEKPVVFHKRVLGRQNYCWNNGLSSRFWVWEGADWRVFVNNDVGVAFEVRTTLSEASVYKALFDYMKRIGISNVELEELLRTKNELDFTPKETIELHERIR
jgi:hypothetical protein